MNNDFDIQEYALKKYPINLVEPPNSRSDYFAYDTNKDERDKFIEIFQLIKTNTTTMKYIIIDKTTARPLHNSKDGRTLTFSSHLVAKEVASQFFTKETDYLIVPINLGLEINKIV